MTGSTAVLFGGLLALIAGCANATPATGPVTARVAMAEMQFTPNRIDVHVGQPLAIELVNQGSQPHDLTFDQPGTHAFVCSIAGHGSMTGAVFVSP